MLEGGGQILRTSAALAALLNKSIHVTNIRGKRAPPGLKAQHLTGVKAVAEICRATVKGAEVGSRELFFEPKGMVSGKFRFDIGTAGSISLVLQALMLPVNFAPGRIEIEITGGTDVRWSPPMDYVTRVTLPLLRRLGYRGRVDLRMRGHYPKGGGRVLVDIAGAGSLNGVQLTSRGKVEKVVGVSHCVKLPRHVAERQAKAARDYLAMKGYSSQIEIESYTAEKDPHLGPGSGILVLAEGDEGGLLGADSVGERGKPAERVGAEAAEKLVNELSSGAPIDRHMGDILVPYLAVAAGSSRVRVSEITMHTLTNVKVIELISEARFDLGGELGKPGVISVQGIGLKA